MLTLMVGSGIASHRRFQEQQELYEAAKFAHLFALEDARYYRAVRLGIERPPEPLSLLAEGTGERYGSSIVLRGKHAPMEIRARERPADLGAWGEALDFSHLIGLFLSLLALLLSYDLVCGERQEGTLQLSLASGLSRHQLLIGEYLGCVLSLIIPLLLASLVTLVMLWLVIGYDVAEEEVMRMALIFMSALLFISALIWVGLCCSALSRWTTTAFIFAFGVWVLVAVVYPNLTLWSAQRLRPVPVTEETLSSEGIFGLALGDRQEVLYETERAQAQTRELALNAKLAQGQLNDSLKVLSPVSSFLALGQILARTDLTAQRDFIAQARRLDQSLRQWQAEKLRRYPERESYYKPSWGPLDVDGLPQPQFRPIPLVVSFPRALPYWGALAVFNLIFYYLAYVFLARYDVRFS
jgi:ABC-type transport system involved in multi-copper enzyme maturation permease subunit